MTVAELKKLQAKLPVSRSVLALNSDPPAPSAPSAPTVLVQATAIEVRPNTDERKLNKTERAYLAYLRAIGDIWIGIQNLTFKLADDTRYTPDFVTVHQGKLQAREVKGFFRDDAKVKVKVAARQFPWIEFCVIRKTKTGWEEQVVKP